MTYRTEKNVSYFGYYLTVFFLSELLLKLAKDNVIWYTAFEVTLCRLAHSLSRKAREILSNAVAVAISCFRHRTGSILTKQKTFKA